MEKPRIYLIRHGRESYDQELRITVQRDPLILTANKIKTLEAGSSCGGVYTSPCERAKISADIIAEGILPIISEVKIFEELSDDHETIRNPVMDILSELRESEADFGIVVSHSPSLEDYTRFRLDNAQAVIRFEDGRISKLEKISSLA